MSFTFAQVTDSGHPPLSSICVVNINVTEESKYPPSVVPLEVSITTSGGLFANRVVGRLHASDQDVQDVLTYSLVSQSPDDRSFSIDQADGKIWADEHLEEGSYALNVSVSDGKFTVWTGVKVHVWVATQQALDSGLTLQLDRMSPEEFLGDYWRGLQRSLGQELDLPRQELHLASLQQRPDPRALEALLIWRPQGGPVRPLPTSRIAGKRGARSHVVSEISVQHVCHLTCWTLWCRHHIGHRGISEPQHPEGESQRLSGKRLPTARLQELCAAVGREAGPFHHRQSCLHHPAAHLGERLPLQRYVHLSVCTQSVCAYELTGYSSCF